MVLESLICCRRGGAREDIAAGRGGAVATMLGGVEQPQRHRRCRGQSSSAACRERWRCGERIDDGAGVGSSSGEEGGFSMFAWSGRFELFFFYAHYRTDGNPAYITGNGRR